MVVARTGSLKIVVSGFIGQYPLGGVAWDYLQYLMGLQRLGHEVFYLEDTGQWPYDPAMNGTVRHPDEDSTFLRRTVDYLIERMDELDLGNSWAYRGPWRGQWFGAGAQAAARAHEHADLILNVSGSLRDPEAFHRTGRLAYIDTDPVFTQVKLARGQQDFQRYVGAHDVHFSFGELIERLTGDSSRQAHGVEGFPANVPDTGIAWRPTRQPIVLSEWRWADPPRNSYTTVMNWTSFNDVTYGGVSFGQKDVEFRRFLELPSRVAPTQLELAVASGKTRQAPIELLRHKGWNTVDPSDVCPDLDSYRAYIASSRGEWSVAKNGYVEGQSGWFSCRSACYLAAGRPVAVQETGFSHVLPTGEGLIGFRDIDGAAAALESFESDYERHAAAARDLAHACFDSDKVLSGLIETAMAATVPMEGVE